MTSIDLTPQTASVARVVAGVRDDQLTDPTPCDGTSVAGMLDHLVGLTLAFRLGAEKTSQAGGPSADADQLPADWRERLPPRRGLGGRHRGRLVRPCRARRWAWSL